MKNIALLSIILIYVFSSCNSNKKTDYLEQSLLLAKENRKELEKVLDHYKNEPEKLHAAQFLIKNMIEKFTLDTLSVISNQVYFDSLESFRNRNGRFNEEDFRNICEKIKKNLSSSKIIQPTFTNDLSFISTQELISHIDHTFETKQKYPWCKQVNFDDFCKYILPYKVRTNYWRDAGLFFQTKYSPLIDSFSNLSITEIGKFIQTDAEKSFFMQWDILSNEYSFLFPTTFCNIAKTQIGLCPEFTTYTVLAARAIGIPAVLNTIPCYGNSDHQHFWLEIIDRDDTVKIYENKTIAYHETIEETVNGMFHSKIPMPSYDHISEQITVQHNRKMAKIYRLNYQIFEENIEFLSSDTDIPVFFKNTGLEDITGKYVKCHDIEIKFRNINPDKKTAYLCCYDSGKWNPVCRTKIKDNKVLFKQMGVNVLYMAGYFKNNTVIPAGEPFILTDNGDIRFLSAATTEEKEKVTLYSKVPLKTNVLRSMAHMVGSNFQLANSPDFSDAVTVHSVNKIPYYEHTIDVDTSTLYRYVICNFDSLIEFCLAEWSIYGQTGTGSEMILRGELMGNKGTSDHPAEKTIDNDRVSYFQNSLKDEKQYLVLDLGKPCKITRIKYNPRSDDNRIVNGELYELYYWNKKWVSLGKQEGANHSLVYSNVPKNALLRIHNHTRGKEHRPFTYENKKQVWW